MKKALALTLSLMMCLALLAGCAGKSDSTSTAGSDTKPATSGSVPAGNVTLDVVTTWGGDDGNRTVYEDAYKAWQTETGNTIEDASGTANEEFKMKINNMFETDQEPDVLFYFNGTASNPFVEAGKVVSLDQIREQYPEYANNMKEGMLPASPLDGKKYSVPAYGYWEGLFVNKAVLEAANVEIPGPETTWEEFLQICDDIKAAGLVPIAASIAEVPHYWFEYTILNVGGSAGHEAIPEGESGTVFDNWVGGMTEMKAMYEAGYFPDNTLNMTDPEAQDLFYNDKAAFLLDGSWRLGTIVDRAAENERDLEDFTVTYVPGTSVRPTTELVSGMSSGWFITKKCFDDPAKFAAAVSFITHMTSAEVLGAMASGSLAITPLADGTPLPEDPNSLQQDAQAMLKGATGTVPAAQDLVTDAARQVLLADNMKLVCGGEMTPEENIKQTLAKNAEG